MNGLIYYAYPIQFAANAEEAVANLVRLIREGDCGHDKGQAYYMEDIKSILGAADEFPRDPVPQFPFSPGEFREILEAVVNTLQSED